MEKRRKELQTQVDEFHFEADTLKQLALEKDKEMNTKLEGGSQSIGLLAVSAMAAPFTGGASLVAIGASGALAAYHFLSAFDCYQLAKQKNKQAENIREQAHAVECRICKQEQEIATRNTQMNEALSLIEQLKADQRILQDILKQLIKFTDVINSIRVFLQYQKP